ncbi:MAG: hypothetical protein ACRDUA_01580 [Micromonosporaceae bacterium]
MSESLDQSLHAPPKRSWVLVGLTGLGALFAIQSWFGTWLTMQLTVSGVRDSFDDFGISYFGAPGIGYGVGNLLLAVLLGLALWRTGRWRSWLSYAALAVCAVMVAALALVLVRLGDIEAAAAAEVIRLRDSVDGLPSYVAFRAGTPGLIVAALATLLFALVAVQLSNPRRGLRIQAVAGVVLCAVAAVMPWMRLWIVDDLRPGNGLEQRYFWLWSNLVECVGVLVAVLVLARLVYGGMRAPSYARHRWAIGSAMLALGIFLVAQVIEVEYRARAVDLRELVSEELDARSTGAGALMGAGAVLLATAMVRSWWHGREEVIPAAPGDSWLPARIRERQT